MRALTILVLVLAAIYSGYWFVGSRTVNSGAADALEQMRMAGWQANVGDIATRGFPSRFDTTLSDLALTPPDGSWQYAAPFVQALALSYAPNKVIAVLPETQTVRIPGQDLIITGTGLRASTGVAASTDLDFQGFTAEGAEITVTSSLGWTINAASLLSAMRPSPVDEMAYDIYGELGEIIFEAGFDELLQTAPAVIQSVSIDGVVKLDQPLNRNGLQSIEPIQPTALELKSAKLRWGEIELNATGTFDVVDGYPEGPLDIKVTNWAQLVDALVAAGTMEPEVAKTYRDAASLLASEVGELDMTVTFRGGQMVYGFLPLGPAPRFY